MEPKYAYAGNTALKNEYPHVQWAETMPPTLQGMIDRLGKLNEQLSNADVRLRMAIDHLSPQPVAEAALAGGVGKEAEGVVERLSSRIALAEHIAATLNETAGRLQRVIGIAD